MQEGRLTKVHRRGFRQLGYRWDGEWRRLARIGEIGIVEGSKDYVWLSFGDFWGLGRIFGGLSEIRRIL